MLLSTLGRLIWVPIAFVISAVASVLVLLTLGQERFTQVLFAARSEEEGLGQIAILLQEALILATGLSVLPALLLIVVGEVARIRSLLYYVIGGGLALALMPLAFRFGQNEPLAVPSVMLLQVLAAAGFAGGFVYWLIAGRRA
ncbi:MAG TPA: hypothetical protein VNK52_04625 [Hyphomicrobiaceae bacterium]|nr:hypothetical protein [Hyphomicrobiaceae bacterium]